MTKSMTRTTWLCLLLLVLPLGCAPARVRLSAEEARATFGTINVTLSAEPPGTAFDRPMTSRGKAAGRGAAEGFVGAIHGGPLGLALSPVAALGGSIYGALAAESPEKVEQAARELDQALAEARLQETLRDLVVRKLNDRGVDARAGAASDLEATVDTVVEARVSQVMLAGSGVNPSLGLFVVAHVSVVRPGGESASDRFVAGGDRRKFLGWASDRAQPFRTQVARELEKLAGKIVDHLLSRPARER